MIRIDYWNIHFPRLCNGSTSDSGSDCGGSNPPWGIKRADLRSAFLFMAPSNIGSVHRPLKAERRVRLPLELKNKNRGKRHSFGCLFFIREYKTEPNREASAPARRKGATDGTVSERRRPGGSRHDVCDQRASTPVGAKK